ncbi:MAG: CDP-diacylglycerol--glycerol-3-phosphate 3-phosphatidyltransferase [Planctomycetes bacterium]|nr:CDP-diacylglycerol--glycerol-3-phosphate 3-phosphatidyltransferase [Planctomycetota bacterium]
MGWTLPNTITVLRLVLAVALFVLLACEPRAVDPAWLEEGEHGLRSAAFAALLLFLVAALSDALDGWLARRYGWTSAFGRVADPFVDKILVCGALVFLCSNPLTAPFVPPWFVVVLIGREFLVTGLRGFVESKGVAFPADRLGKLKMVLQCVLISLVLWRFASEARPHEAGGWSSAAIAVSLWLTLLLTVGSGMQYVYRARQVLFAR